jgi:hypothetical protein
MIQGIIYPYMVVASDSISTYGFTFRTIAYNKRNREGLAFSFVQYDTTE